MPRIEFEHVGGTVIAVDQSHFVRDGEVVVPQFDGADMPGVVAAEQHQHGGKEFAGEYRQRDAAGQPGFLGLVGALEVGIGELGQHDRMAGCPGLAGQPLVIGEQGVFAERPEFGELVAAQRAAEFQPRPGPVRNP